MVFVRPTLSSCSWEAAPPPLVDVNHGTLLQPQRWAYDQARSTEFFPVNFLMILKGSQSGMRPV